MESCQRVARDLNPDLLPSNLMLGGVPIAPSEIANTFAGYFSDKIRLNVSKATINANGLYDGKCNQITLSTSIAAEEQAGQTYFTLT